MATWGLNDAASNSVSTAPAGFNTVANTTTRNALFGNTTIGAFVNNMVVGQYGVDSTEANVRRGPVTRISTTFPGSGYTANGTVSFTVVNGGSGATANAQANSTGRIAQVNLTAGGSQYIVPPIVTVSPPTAVTFNANTAVNANGFIAIATNVFQVNDRVRYLVAAGNTALAGLSNNTQYLVQAANSTGIYISSITGGPAITLTKGLTEAGHSFTGETATAAAIVGGAQGIAHAGWVVRTEGTGGRAGRVQLETLVAMGSITGDAADDSILPDS